jgi:hypothetical protein
VEILQKGEVIVDRRVAGDADNLKAILKGDYTYEQVMKMAENLVAEMEKLYKESTLPKKPDLEQINQLCVELVEMRGW